MGPLPNDLLILILLRLPVKSLLRFRCVCKSWLSIISDPRFARSHFDLAASVTRRVMLLDTSSLRTLSIELDASLHDESAHAAITHNIPKRVLQAQIVGSCRGFLLLSCHFFDHRLYLWNPSTGVHKLLPPPPVPSNVGEDAPYSTAYRYGLYGFVYDPSTDDDVVFLISTIPVEAGWTSRFEFFSLRANSWGIFRGLRFPYRNHCNEPRVGSVLNGAIHWLAFRYDDTKRHVIVAFDLAERNVSEIPLPNDFQGDIFHCDLCVYGGFLSLWEVRRGDKTDIWVMKEYKVRSSWTKSTVFPLVDHPALYFSPICLTGTGDILGFDGNEGLVKCNANGELLEHYEYPHLRKSLMTAYFRMGAAIYTESLLPLPDDDRQAEDEPQQQVARRFSLMSPA